MKKTTITLLASLIITMALPCKAQEKLHADTLQCPIVGFHVAMTGPWNSLSSAIDANGNNVAHATLAEMYEAPWLDFGVDFSYKWRNGLFVNLDGTFIFGDDNLKNREERMADVYTSGSMIVGANGLDAVVTCHNRALALKAGVGKIFILNHEKNPNSGPFAAVNAGILQQQTIFTLNEQIDAAQVNHDYGLLYDNQRRGFLLSQEIGFWFMGNKSAILNFHIGFELTEMWSRSTRDYVIDDYIGLRGKDNNKYFDVLYGLKLTWMFPITGKTAYDYYYF